MIHTPGIKTITDANGRKYLHIDLDMHGDNELLEDFLDTLAAKYHVRGETVTLEEFNTFIDNRLKKNVQSYL
jgi:hypothetical protein